MKHFLSWAVCIFYLFCSFQSYSIPTTLRIPESMAITTSTLLNDDYLLVFVDALTGVIKAMAINPELGYSVEEFQISEPGKYVSIPEIIPHRNGGFSVSWYEVNQQYNNESERVPSVIKFASFNPDYTKRPNSDVPGPTYGKKIALSSDGKEYLSTWLDQFSCVIKLDTYKKDSSLMKSTEVSIGFDDPSILALQNDEYLLLWAQYGYIYAQKIDEHYEPIYPIRKKIVGNRGAKTPIAINFDQDFYVFWSEGEGRRICFLKCTDDCEGREKEAKCPIQSEYEILSYAISTLISKELLVSWFDSTGTILTQRLNPRGELIDSPISYLIENVAYPSSLMLAGHHKYLQFIIFWKSEAAVNGVHFKFVD